MMSRPMLLVFLLLILIITSQFEWKQQLVSDIEASPSITRKQQQISKREEAVKEKLETFHLFPLSKDLTYPECEVLIILSQEKNIQKLNELVRSLRKQLLLCRGNSNETSNDTVSSLTENAIELERQQILED